MILRKIFKVVFRVIIGLIGFVATYLLVAFVLSMISVNNEPTPPSSTPVCFYILTNGDHTDVVLPVRNEIYDWSKEIKFQNTISKDTSARYVAFGWGDKGFYLNTPTWAQLKFSVAFKATFALSTAAIHATFYKTLQENDACKKIAISAEQYLRLINYIQKSLKTDTNGDIINIKTNANYNDNDAFYEAKGRYNLFYTCNTWANNALKACGQKACLWTPFDKGIFYHYHDK